MSRDPNPEDDEKHENPEDDFLGESTGMTMDDLDRILGQFKLEEEQEPVEIGDLTPTAPTKSISDRLGDVQHDDAKQTVKLKKILAYSAFGTVALQLAFANAAFFFYGFYSRWKIEPEVMMSWMATTVIETLGVVLIIARNLFPTSQEE